MRMITGALIVGCVALGLAARRADAKGCTEHSAVVGFEHCGHFGAWSRDDDLPRLQIELDVFDHHYLSEPFTLGMPPPPGPIASRAYGAGIRFLGGIGERFYTGVELLPGGVTLATSAIPQPADSVYFGMHAIVGVHASALVFAFAAEVAAGFRYEAFDSCADRGCAGISASQDRRELSARLRVNVFVTPIWSFGLGIGQSVLDRDDHEVMVSTAIHVRVMDGM